MAKTTSVLLALLCFSTMSVEAGVYRWVDSDGRVHFGDRPPQESDANEVTIKGSGNSVGSQQSAPKTYQQRLQKQQKMLDAFREEREQKKQDRQKQEADAAKRKKDCLYAKAQLDDYRETQLLYDINDDGSRRYLSDAEYKATIARYEKRVKQLCKGL